MDFITGRPISINWKSDTYASILIIIDRLIKMIYYKLVKVIINDLGLAKTIIHVVMRHHNLPDFIISDCKVIFISKFWSSLCYFFKIKK